MKIIVYRKYHESDLYELTLAHTIFSTEHNFVSNEDIRQFSDAFEYEYPFEIIECTELELEVFVKFLVWAFDIWDVEEVGKDRILVKKEAAVLSCEDAAEICRNEIQELEDKLQELRYNMELYNEVL